MFEMTPMPTSRTPNEYPRDRLMANETHSYTDSAVLAYLPVGVESHIIIVCSIIEGNGRGVNRFATSWTGFMNTEKGCSADQ